VPIDRDYRKKLRVSGSHSGHSVWTSKTGNITRVHGTLVGVDAESCSGCQKCVSACPVAVLVPWTESSGKQIVDPVNEAECLGCLLCEVVCPEDAISIQRSPGSTETLESLLRGL
jgi:NAD-dependent dihydropyrimidine dehydrogenase PreA subunit